jgi:hypothetical protein
MRLRDSAKAFKRGAVPRIPFGDFQMENEEGGSGCIRGAIRNLDEAESRFGSVGKDGRGNGGSGRR